LKTASFGYLLLKMGIFLIFL